MRKGFFGILPFVALTGYAASIDIIRVQDARYSCRGMDGTVISDNHTSTNVPQENCINAALAACVNDPAAQFGVYLGETLIERFSATGCDVVDPPIEPTPCEHDPTINADDPLCAPDPDKPVIENLRYDGVKLDWELPQRLGVSDHRVLADGVFIGGAERTDHVVPEQYRNAACFEVTALGPVNSDPVEICPPSAPDSFTLRWETPTLNADGTPLTDLAGINIYRDGVLVETVGATVTSYETNIPGCYQLAAPDLAGNESELTEQICK